MSEKVKCPNPECKAGLVLEMEQGMAFTRIKCLTCNGTGFAPTGEELLTDVKIWDKELPSFFRDNTFPEFELETYGLAVAKAQAAFTSGQMIEGFRNCLGEHCPEILYSDWFTELESRYGGG